jgi:CRISPR/Cas system-associated exonuclease Cas4 (RecB family)
MSLKSMLASLKGKPILTPVLQDYRAKQDRLVAEGKISKKAGVIRDATLTIKAMKERIEEFNHGEDPVGDFFHPSSLGGCLRRTWFSAKGAKPEGKAREDALRDYYTFETGTALHVLTQNLCERAGILEQREVPILSTKHKIIGHADGIVKIDGVRYLLEIKTINMRGYATVVKQPMHSHKVQMHAYMGPLKLKWSIIYYICKDTGQIREHVIQFDEKFYKQWVHDRVHGYFQKLHANIMPEREEGGSNCQYCPFAGLCFDKAKLETFMKGVKKGVVKKPKMKDAVRNLFAKL